MNSQIEELEWTFKALAYRKRLEILVLLLGDGSMTVGEISQYVDAPLNTVSRNLAVLAQIGLVSCRKRGTYVRYGIRKVGCSPQNKVILSVIRHASRSKRANELLKAIVDDLLSGTYRNVLRVINKSN